MRLMPAQLICCDVCECMLEADDPMGANPPCDTAEHHIASWLVLEHTERIRAPVSIDCILMHMTV